jgi:hypothetical protein
MPTDQNERDVNIPSAGAAVVAEFQDRAKADKAVDALAKAGFATDQISFVARGAEHEGDKFIPGVLMITVHPDGRADAASRVLREQGAAKVTSGMVSATGEVLEEGEREREEASS